MKATLKLLLILLAVPLACSAQTGTKAGRIDRATFANLGTTTAGEVRICEDCLPTRPCGGGGTGALATVINGQWDCKDVETDKIWLGAALCNNVTAYTDWDLPTSGAATPTCVTGTNVTKGVLAFPDTPGGFSAQRTYLLPGGWVAGATGGVDTMFLWSTGATTGAVKWWIYSVCTPTDGTATDDPAFVNFTSFTVSAFGSANRISVVPLTGIPTSGCGPLSLLHVKVFRDGAGATDTIGATANFIGLELSTRR